MTTMLDEMKADRDKCKLMIEKLDTAIEALEGLQNLMNPKSYNPHEEEPTPAPPPAKRAYVYKKRKSYDWTPLQRAMAAARMKKRWRKWKKLGGTGRFRG